MTYTADHARALNVEIDPNDPLIGTAYCPIKYTWVPCEFTGGRRRVLRNPTCAIDTARADFERTAAELVAGFESLTQEIADVAAQVESNNRAKVAARMDDPANQAHYARALAKLESLRKETHAHAA